MRACQWRLAGGSDQRASARGDGNRRAGLAGTGPLPAGAGRTLHRLDAPPYLPYAPALAQAGIALKRVLVVQTRGVQESLWATEQTLRCPAFGAVLSWPSGIVDKNVRRLQLAAEAGGTLGILYRPAEAAREHSPAALRLRLAPTSAGLTVDIHKCRGGRAGARLQLASMLWLWAGIALRFCSERLNRPIVTCTET